MTNTSDSIEAQELLLRELSLIDRVIAKICRRRGMSSADVDDFTAHVYLRLIENDYAALRRFGGRSSFGTYIASLVDHWLLDELVHKHGKWRTSAEARRLGETAINLERLLYRDGLTLDDALPVLRAKEPTLTRDDLAQIAARLPKRPPRPRTVSLDSSMEVAAEPPRPQSDDLDLVARVSDTLRRFLETLDETDRAILRYLFAEELRISEIARALQLDQKSVYRRRDALLARIRRELEAARIDARDVAELIGSDSVAFDFGLGIARRPAGK